MPIVFGNLIINGLARRSAKRCASRSNKRSAQHPRNENRSDSRNKKTTYRSANHHSSKGAQASSHGAPESFSRTTVVRFHDRHRAFYFFFFGAWRQQTNISLINTN